MAFEYSKEEWMRHANYELDLSEDDPELKAFYIKLVDFFTDYPHTENTLYFMPEALEKLFRHENLRQLTDHPNEWEQVTDELWRNKRNPRAYSNDGGHTTIMFPRFEENHSNNNIKLTNTPPKIMELFEKLKDIKNF
jgi:uncharacterized protein YxeA